MKTWGFIFVVAILLVIMPVAVNAASDLTHTEAWPKPIKEGDVLTVKSSSISLRYPCGDPDEATNQFEAFKKGEKVDVAEASPLMGSVKACGYYRIISRKSGDISWVHGWRLRP